MAIMKRRLYLTYLFQCLLLTTVFSQNDEQIELSLSASDTITLSIFKVLPDSFPNIEIIFNAETQTGNPIWSLNKEDLLIEEDYNDCEIIKLKKISDEKSISIALVIDHSMSMIGSLFEYQFDTSTKIEYDTLENYPYPLPSGYIPPLEDAKKAVLQFLESIEWRKDSILVVGFGSKVDSLKSFSNDSTDIYSQVKDIYPQGGTSLYDAVDSALNKISLQSGIRVIIALTDGIDNESNTTTNQLVKKADSLKIPLFMIGFGKAMQDSLISLANLTKGEFNYSKSSNSLDSVYTKIARKILSVYSVQYRSSNLKSIDSIRNIKISFSYDSVTLKNNEYNLQLSNTIISYLKQKENNADNLNKLYLGLGVTIILSGGLLLYIKTRKKVSSFPPIINDLYPNPAFEKIIIVYDLNGKAEGKILISNQNGQTFITETVGISGSAELIIDNLPSGLYTCSLVTDSISNTINIIKK